MKCWICGKEGNTGEHKIKASDLRSIFGDVSQASPVYFHTSKAKNIPIGSVKKSNRLKSEALICNECNTSHLKKDEVESWSIQAGPYQGNCRHDIHIEPQSA